MFDQLDQWLLARPDTDFPQSAGIKHRTRLTAVAEYLNKEIHPNVEKGALLRGDGYLTDHAPDHIKKLIRRASDLLAPLPAQNSEPTAATAKSSGPLSAYEAYLLVMAIQFHDVGNIFGRAGHETRSGEVMQQLGHL